MFKTVYLVNEQSGQTLTLSEDSAITATHVLDELDWGTVNANHKSVQLVDMIGSQPTNTVIGTRDISIVGWLVANSQTHMNNLKKQMNTTVIPLNWITLQYQQYALRFKPDKSVKYSKDVSINNEIMCKFLITGEAFDPLFKLIKSDVVIMQLNSPVPLFPLISEIGVGLIFGDVSTATFKKVVNEGDVAAGVKISLKAIGPVVNPKVTNLMTGLAVEIDTTKLPGGQFDLGDEIVISTEFGKKSVRMIRDGVETNVFNAVTIGSRFLTLLPGSNNIEISAAENVSNIRMTITFSPRFMEVQTIW